MTLRLVNLSVKRNAHSGFLSPEALAAVLPAAAMSSVTPEGDRNCPCWSVPTGTVAPGLEQFCLLPQEAVEGLLPEPLAGHKCLEMEGRQGALVSPTARATPAAPETATCELSKANAHQSWQTTAFHNNTQKSARLPKSDGSEPV